MERVFNFSAGPSALPLPVLKKARNELLDYQGSGMSIMEMSHRSPKCQEMAHRAETGLRSLYGIKDDYHVLFLQGGASMQFAMVPINLASSDDTVDYVEAGSWSKKAIAEARRLASVNVIMQGINRVRDLSVQIAHDQAQYVHVTSNETIEGVQFNHFPDTGDVPLVVDMSSDFLSRPLNLSKFGLIYAGAQKNSGSAGLTVVIVHRDLCGRAREGTPKILDYQAHADSGSMYNTPPVFNWYLAGLVFDWVIGEGGLTAMETRSHLRSQKLYSVIDKHGIYHGTAPREYRSRMNVCFRVVENTLEEKFLIEARHEKLFGLKGHRNVGGIRASIYNAVPDSAVDALANFMDYFATQYSRSIS